MLKITASQNLIKLKEVLNQLTDDQFSAPLEVFNGSSIGMHVRHILEFYICLMEASVRNVVNYDERKRDHELECSIRKSVETIEQILDYLGAVVNDFTLTLKANYSTESAEEEIALESTFFRELLYNVEHTVHHLAIIRIGIKALNDHNIAFDNQFGVAASTTRNKNICAQ